MVRWNEKKDRWLIQNRGVSFKTIAERIVEGNYQEILENPTRIGQDVFIMTINDYTWVVPFVIETDETIFLKTAYPSRKFHKRYRCDDEK